MIIVILPFGVSALVFIPKTAGDLAENLPSRDKSKRLYIVNCFLMLSSVIFLVLGITQRTLRLKEASFLVPFLLCWPIFVIFYGARLSEGYALTPHSILHPS